MIVYGWMWRHLPGSTGLRLLETLVLVVAVVAALFLWVFPMVAPLVPFNDNTVGEERDR
jgi:hypothetical protein